MHKHLESKRIGNWNAYFQERSNTCGIAAVRTIASNLGTEVSEKALIRKLHSQGLHLADDGVSAPYLNLLAVRLGFDVTFHVNHKRFKNLFRGVKEEKILDRVDFLLKRKRTFRKDFRKQLASLRSAIKEGGRIIFYSEKNRPNYQDLVNALSPKGIAIVRVTSTDYYKIYEKWGHFIVYKTKSKTKRFDVLDPYLQMIKLDYPRKWQNYLDNAARFDWDSWSDLFLEVRSR